MSLCNLKNENFENGENDDDSKDRSLTEHNFSNSWKYILNEEFDLSEQKRQNLKSKSEPINKDLYTQYDKNSLVKIYMHDSNSEESRRLPSYKNDITNTFYSVVRQTENTENKSKSSNNYNSNGRNSILRKSNECDHSANIKHNEQFQTLNRNKKPNKQLCYWNEQVPNTSDRNSSSHNFSIQKPNNFNDKSKCNDQNGYFYKSNSKSMNDIDVLSYKDEYPLLDKSDLEEYLFLERDSVCSEDLSLLSFPCSIKADEKTPIKYHSTLSLKEDHKEPKLGSCGKLSKTKSHSLSNIPLYKKPNYSQVQSKVKKYIQDCKSHELKETKSLPVTPVCSKKENSDENFLLLDDNILASLSLSDKKNVQLQEDLEKIKEEIVNGNSTPELLEKLFEKLKHERTSRINQNITLNALQLHYDKLLLKYAQARNTIDALRFYKDFHEKNKNIPPNESTAGNSKRSNFKKAYSTSNIFHACSVTPRPNSNLVRYPSSPLIDQNPTSYYKVEENNLDAEYFNLEESTCLNSTHSTLSEWYERCEYLQEKLKEYMILEDSGALKLEERNVIWNFILEKHAELMEIYQLFNENAACKKSLEDISEAINVISNKVPFLHNKSKKSNIETNRSDSSTLYDAGLPVNMPYPSTCKYPDGSNLSFGAPVSCLSQNALKNKGHSILLKQSLQKDADSGCPPSDRSAKNSHFPSLEKIELSGNSLKMKEESPPNCNVSKCSCGVVSKNAFQFHDREKENRISMYSINAEAGDKSHKKKTLFRNSLPSNLFKYCNDEDYDASESSGVDEFFEYENSKRISKKRPPRLYKTYANMGHNRFEDKFVCEHRFSKTPAAQNLYPNKASYVDFSQMERNSKYFEDQVKVLKSKGLNRKRNKNFRLSLPNHPVTLQKAMFSENGEFNRPLGSNLRLKEDVVTGNKDFASVLSRYRNRSECQNHLSNFDVEDYHRGTDSNIYIENPFPNMKPSLQRRKFSTSTPKSKKLDTSGSSFLPSDIGNFGYQKRCNSLPSLQNGTDPEGVYFQELHQQQYPTCSSRNDFRKSNLRKSSQVHKQNWRYGNSKYEVAHANLINSLDAATSLAEKVRSRSQNMLTVFRTDLFPFQT